MNPCNFSVFCINKNNQNKLKKIYKKKIFVEKKITNFTAMFLNGNG